MITNSIPEISLPDVEAQVEALIDAEEAALLALGSARLAGRPGREELRELRDVRGRMEIARAVHRVALLQEGPR